MARKRIHEQLRGIIWKAPVTEEVDAELRFHPEMVTRELVEEAFRGEPANMSVGNYVDLNAVSTTFRHLAAQEFTQVNLQEGEQPERLSAGRVTHDFFSAFGVRPQLGRTFLPE